MSVCNKRIDSELCFEVELTIQLCEAVDSPRSVAVAIMLRHGLYQEYMDLQCDPLNYNQPEVFSGDYLVSEILRKSPNIPLGINRAEQAKSSFWDSELLCYYVNEDSRNVEPFPEYFQFVFEVSKILGSLSTSALQYIEAHMSHGPGATVGIKGVGSTASDKFEQSITSTVQLMPFYKSLTGPVWHELNRKPVKIVGGSKFTTVPKNSKTDRGICVEPTLNMFVQKGIGAYIRKRLRRFGCDLQDQSKNRFLASVAYDRSLCTIDLSGASDSVSTGLVARSLPPDWVELLYLGRSHRVTIDGDIHELEKWSSMGNGYTFELESLLFLSVVRSIVPPDEYDNCSVYGDDIIVPAKYAIRVITALNFLGFNVNKRKTFLAGMFFESCGHDYFKGRNVRPFYLRGSNGKIPYALQASNALRLYSQRVFDGISCDAKFRPVWVWLFNQIPSNWRSCRVPAYFGDVGVIVSSLEARNHLIYNEAYQNYQVRYMQIRPKKIRKFSYGSYLGNLIRLGALTHPDGFEIWGIDYSEDVIARTLGFEVVRGLFRSPKLRKASILYWPNGLQWST
jgi:hypothetical protein